MTNKHWTKCDICKVEKEGYSDKHWGYFWYGDDIELDFCPDCSVKIHDKIIEMK